MEKFTPQEQPISFERQEGRELKPEEKENLIDAWLRIAVDHQTKPNNIDSLNNQQAKEWFYGTLMEDTAKLAEEWDLQPNNDLIERIKGERDFEQRARLEMDYIEIVRAKIQEFKKANPSDLGSTRWDSWPSIMRDKKTFNCVGGTLLGISLLDRIGVRSHHGTPPGHVLNIITLSTGEWVYADFTNNQVKKIEPMEIAVGGIKTLKLKEPDIIYHYVPLLDNSDVVSSIIGNFNSIQRDVKRKRIDPMDKQEAKRLFTDFAEQFRKNDFLSLQKTLYSSETALHLTREMQDERNRIKKIRSFSSSTKKYFDTLNLQEKKSTLKEIEVNAEAIRKLFYDNDNKIMEEASPFLRKALQLLVKKTKNTKMKNPELYRDFVELLVKNR